MGIMAVQISNSKYQLPGSNNTYVDLVDDEDVKLMFDEWAEYLEEQGKAARNAKLHIYVDYSEKPRVDMGMQSGGHAHAGLDTISETASADTPVARAPPPPPAMEARASEERLSQENSPMGQSSMCLSIILSDRSRKMTALLPASVHGCAAVLWGGQQPSSQKVTLVQLLWPACLSCGQSLLMPSEWQQ